MARCVVSIATALLFPLPGGSQQPSSPAGDRQQSFQLSVDVNLVVLHVTVRDNNGDFVPGLQKKDFIVYEDGVPEEIKYLNREDVPVTAGLVVDNSGSMRQKRPEVIKAALDFAQSSNPQDQMFVVDFNERVWMGLPPTILFTSKPDDLEAALSKTVATGRTALYDAVARGMDQLRKSRWDKRVLFVVSDGGDNASKHDLHQIMKTAEQSNAIIYTVGLFDEFSEDRNPHVLKRLARATGGEWFFPETAAELSGIAKHVAMDIRNQYAIAYSPRNRNEDGRYRTIRVTAATPEHHKLFVRTRAGYLAPSKEKHTSPAMTTKG